MILKLLLFLSLSILASTACSSSKELHQQSVSDSVSVDTHRYSAVTDSVRTSQTSWVEALTFRDIIIEEMPREADSVAAAPSGFAIPKVRSPTRRIIIGEASVSSRRQYSDSVSLQSTQSVIASSEKKASSELNLESKEMETPKSPIPSLLVLAVLAVSLLLIRKFVGSD